MPKRPTSQTASAITPASFAEAAARLDDFGFEMQVRAVLSHDCPGVEHGWTYIDPVEEKPRQFDFRALCASQSGFRQVRLAVECKNLSPNAPLLVSGTKRTKAEAFHDFIVSDGTVGHRVLIMRDKKHNFLYPAEAFVGKSLLQLIHDSGRWTSVRDDAKQIYNRWSQALASSMDLAELATCMGAKTGELVRTMVLPVVVVPDGMLWTLEYDEAGGTVGPPAPVNYTTLFLKHRINLPVLGYHLYLTHVHFVTLSGLRRLLEDLREPQVDWEIWFSPDAKQELPPPPGNP